MGKALGIDDQSKNTRPKPWNDVNLKWATSKTLYHKNYKPKKLKIQTKPADRKYYEFSEPCKLSTKMSNLRSIYAQDFKPFKSKHKRKRKKRKDIVGPSFCAVTHYDENFLGVKPKANPNFKYPY